MRYDVILQKTSPSPQWWVRYKNYSSVMKCVRSNQFPFSCSIYFITDKARILSLMTLQLIIRVFYGTVGMAPIRNSYSFIEVQSFNLSLVQLHAILFHLPFSANHVKIFIVRISEQKRWGWLIKTHWMLHVSSASRSRDIVVVIATGYGLDDREFGVRAPVGSGILSSPCRPDQLWDPPNPLSNGYRGIFPGGKAAGAWNWSLTSNECRGQENVDLYIHSLICLHVIVLN
jgi:hypothetical protein